jgi:hypothetical protein
MAYTEMLSKMIRVGCVCSTYIVVSGGLINFNKFIVDRQRFPHPLMLTALHMLASFCLSLIFYMVRPSMYPGMEATAGKRGQVYKTLIPIGVLFAIMLYCSNTALLYCSVPFLQFMKEANVVLVFSFSCMAGLQVMNRPRLAVIFWVILGSSLCVSGEMNFALVGFIFQAVSQLAECTRAVLAELVMKGDFKIDPFSYTLLVSPICLTVLIIGNICTWKAQILEDLMVWWPYILPNACMAFTLNIVIAKVVVETSAVGFNVTGIVKDILMVLFASVYFSTEVSPRQWMCFCITLSGVFFWSLMKVAPEHPFVECFERALCVPLKAPPPPFFFLEEQAEQGGRPQQSKAV